MKVMRFQSKYSQLKNRAPIFEKKKDVLFFENFF